MLLHIVLPVVLKESKKLPFLREYFRYSLPSWTETCSLQVLQWAVKATDTLK